MREDMSASGAATAESFDDAVDLRVMVNRILMHRWWVVASVVIFTGLFITAAFLLTPIYRAGTILIPAKSDKGSDAGGGALGGIGGVASLVGINLEGSDSLTEEALAVLKSRQFTEKFIDDRALMPVLFAKIWDARTGKWTVPEKRQPTPSRAYRYFDKRIRNVVREKKTSLITLNVDWSDRIAAADWANDLVRRLNLEMRQRAMERADLAVSYLEKEFESTTAVATRDAIGRLIEGQVRQRMYAAVTQEYAFRVIDRALPPDKDDRYSPNKLMLAVAGPIVGLVIGILCVLGYAALRANPHARQPDR